MQAEVSNRFPKARMTRFGDFRETAILRPAPQSYIGCTLKPSQMGSVSRPSQDRAASSMESRFSILLEYFSKVEKSQDYRLSFLAWLSDYLIVVKNSQRCPWTRENFIAPVRCSSLKPMRYLEPLKTVIPPTIWVRSDGLVNRRSCGAAIAARSTVHPDFVTASERDRVGSRWSARTHTPRVGSKFRKHVAE